MDYQKVKMLSPAEASEYLGVNQRTLRKWVAENRLTAYRYSHRAVRYKTSDLDKFIQGHQIGKVA